jgi:hypothetical protein
MTRASDASYCLPRTQRPLRGPPLPRSPPSGPRHPYRSGGHLRPSVPRLRLVLHRRPPVPAAKKLSYVPKNEIVILKSSVSSTGSDRSPFLPVGSAQSSSSHTCRYCAPQRNLLSDTRRSREWRAAHPGTNKHRTRNGGIHPPFSIFLESPYLSWIESFTTDSALPAIWRSCARGGNVLIDEEYCDVYAISTGPERSQNN